jgi:hypothetical protein
MQFFLSFLSLMVAHFAVFLSDANPVLRVLEAKDLVVADTIYFRNPSFEGMSGESMTPSEWIVNTPGSTPDLLPGAWKLKATPHEGATCLGLVVRNDKTTEDITQVLSEQLKADQCYEFKAWLSRLPKYVGFDHPCQLRIYGGQNGGREELLTSTNLITNTDWKEFKIQFTPKKNTKTLTFVAWYGPGITFKYNGNLLIDDLSVILKCNRA